MRPQKGRKMNATIIDKNTTFSELIRILSKRPEAEEAARAEAEEKAREVQAQKAIDMFGEYANFSDDESSLAEERPGVLKKEGRRPGANQLRMKYPQIAKMGSGPRSTCEVFSNGYAIYDNGDRKTVLWVPDCGSFTYHFGALRESELEYQKQESKIDEDIMGALPWHCALILAGEESIERNLSHPRSKGTVSDFDEEEWNSVIPASHWTCGVHFDGPEEAYLKKEAAKERRMAMTDKQRKAYVLYYEEGYNQNEIAEMLGVSQPAVKKLLDKGAAAISKIEKSSSEGLFFGL